MRSHGVKKETYVEADEKTTKALTYDLLDNLYGKIEDLVDCHSSQVKECDERFDNLEKEKLKNAGKATLGGLIGGFIAVMAKWIISR